MLRVIAAWVAVAGLAGPPARPFTEAIGEIDQRYLDPDALGPALDAGLAGILSRLDEHSYVLNPEQRARQREAAGAAVTTGLTLRRRAGRLEVAGVLPGSPAARSGLNVGDTVRSVEGTSTFRSAAEANLALFGAVGEVRTVEVAATGTISNPRVHQLELVPRRRVSVVESKIVEHARTPIGVICVHAFWTGVGAEVRAVLARQVQAGVKGVVLDVRENPGGALDEALIVADALVSEGLLMRTRGRHGAILREEQAHRPGTDGHTKVVVLIDRHTASAAELLAMTLHDHGRATLVGETTYGKGTVQERYGLSDGSLLSLTIARYYGPADRTPDGRGVPPDVVVPDMRSALARAVALAGG